MSKTIFFNGTFGEVESDDPISIVLLGPTSGHERKPLDKATVTAWRAEFIGYVMDIAPAEMVDRMVFVIPEFIGDPEGAEERTFGNTEVPADIKMGPAGYGLEIWKENHFANATIIALYLRYNTDINDSPGWSGRIEAGDVLRGFAAKSIAAIPPSPLAKRGKDQYLYSQTRGARFVPEIAEGDDVIFLLAKAVIEALR